MSMLNVGDVVFFENTLGVYKYKIDRVTDKTAFIRQIALKREIHPTCGIESVEKKDRWDASRYCLPTPKLEREWLFQSIRFYFAHKETTGLTIEQLQLIAKTINLEV